MPAHRVLSADEVARFEELCANARAMYGVDDAPKSIEPIEWLKDLRPPDDDGPCGFLCVDGVFYYVTPTQFAYVFGGNLPEDS